MLNLIGKLIKLRSISNLFGNLNIWIVFQKKKEVRAKNARFVGAGSNARNIGEDLLTNVKRIKRKNIK